MSEKELKQSLAAKLAEACDAVGGVEKRGRNETQRYDYVKAADVAKAIRHELFQRGIIILPDELECKSQQLTYVNAKGETRNVNEVILNTAYTITDGSETMIFHGVGIAWDSGDKAIYKAKTGALKYFLRSLGLIPDEKDDPENDGTADVETKIADSEQRFLEREEGEQRIAAFQVKAFWDAAKRSGKSEAQIQAFLASLGNYVQVEQILKKDWQPSIKWASSPSTVPANEEQLLAGLEASVASVEAKRAVKVTQAVKRAISANLDAAAPVLNHAESQESHVMEVSGIVKEVKQLSDKNRKPFLIVTMADLPEDIAGFSTWDTKLFPSLIQAKGKTATLYFTERILGGKKYQTITSLEA